MKALIDSDVLVYKIGFACETKQYKVTDPDGSIEYVLPSKKEALNINKDIEETVDVLPEKYAARMLETTIDHIMEDVEAKEYVLYLTDSKSNFRNEVAVTYPYKGNRIARKPIHFNYLRNLMIKKYKAVLCVGQEADDAMGIAQDKERHTTTICSIDKDLLMIPGFHYNLDSGKKIFAHDPGKIELKGNKLVGFGFKWFCAQMLMGDPTDNIKGVPQIGPKKAHKLLGKRTAYSKLWNRVRAIYRWKGLSKDRLEENARLLWIRREEKEDPIEWIKERA